MKKLIAVTIVAIMMLAMGASAFALVAESSAASAQPPVWISGMTVSDAWMSGLTMTNWTGSLTQQAYAEGNYIWFIARISVAAPGDTDAEHLWTGSGETATLTITGKDNCLNLTSANMATLAKINGMSVTARQIQNNNTSIVQATANQAKFTFKSIAGYDVNSDNVVEFSPDSLQYLGLDGIYAKNTWVADPDATPYTPARNDATMQKDFYLHFMGIANAATEGVCIGTMKVNGSDEFVRQGDTYVAVDNIDDPARTADYWYGTPYSTPGQVATGSSYLGYGNWYQWNNVSSNNESTYLAGQISSTQINPGDRSVPVILYNTYNKITYAIAEINGKAVPSPNMELGWRGPYANAGSIYVLMTKDCADFKVGFSVANGAFQGLVTWNDDFRDGSPVLDDYTGGKAGDFNFFNNKHTWNAAYYIPLTSNDVSNSVNLVASYNGGTMSTGELEAIFNFFGFAYTNPKAPIDADFLLRSSLISTQEARYNVANAVITTPDTTVVIPQTGDAASSTGLILVASAILAAAAVGFVLSKRAHN